MEIDNRESVRIKFDLKPLESMILSRGGYRGEEKGLRILIEIQHMNHYTHCLLTAFPLSSRKLDIKNSWKQTQLYYISEGFLLLLSLLFTILAS